MKRIFSRTKQGQTNPAFVDDNSRSLIQCIEEVISELGWGAQCTWDDRQTLRLRTVVFGDVDTTIFSGTDEEMIYFYKLLENRNRITAHLLETMGIALTDKCYYINEVLICLELWLGGNTNSDDLLSLLKPVPPKQLPTVEEVIKADQEAKDTLAKFPDLSAEVGVNTVVRQNLGWKLF